MIGSFDLEYGIHATAGLFRANTRAVLSRIPGQELRLQVTPRHLLIEGIPGRV